MTGRSWLSMTFGMVIVASALCLYLAWQFDPYGIWKEPKGRSLSIYFFERKVKLLLNERYVPANFEGLIIGPSSSSNWSVPSLNGTRIFNESLPGGNAAEEQLLLVQALKKGHFRLGVLLLSPGMTRDHDLEDGIEKTTTSEAMASIHLVFDEVAMVLQAHHIYFSKAETAPDGQIIDYLSKRLDPQPADPDDYRIDSVDLNKYRDMVNSLRDQGAFIVYVVPPYYEPCYRLVKQQNDAYVAEMQKELPVGQLIDFGQPGFDALRNDPNNFYDCVHTTPDGSAKVVALLQKLVPQVMNR